MEFQSFENTKCCHRLYDLLKRSTILDLTGEPWFRVQDGDLYFCSNTTSHNVASLTITRVGKEENYAYNDLLKDPVFAPIKKLITLPSADSRVLSRRHREYKLCNDLGDFFRIHYQKFN